MCIRESLDIVVYYEGHGQGFDHYCAWLDERGYHGIDWMPHDAKFREAGAPGARTRIETLVTLGRKPELAPEQPVMDGITPAARPFRSPGSTPSAAPRALRRCDPIASSGTRRREPSRRRPNTIGRRTAGMRGVTYRSDGVRRCESPSRRSRLLASRSTS